MPVLIAVGLAQGEIKRRQKQDQLREELRTKAPEKDKDQAED